MVTWESAGALFKLLISEIHPYSIDAHTRMEKLERLDVGGRKT